MSAVDDNGLIDDLFADEAGELIGHREEPLALRDVKVEILLRFFGIALKQQQSTNKGNHWVIEKITYETNKKKFFPPTTPNALPR